MLCFIGVIKIKRMSLHPIVNLSADHGDGSVGNEMENRVKSLLTLVVMSLCGFTISAQQLQTGDSFEFTNADGVTKKYVVVGENLITNPSFDNGAVGWTGGVGGALSNVEVYNSGGVDGGAYIRPTANAGKGSDSSIGTAWDVEVGKTYVFSFFLKNQTNTAAENPAVTATSRCQ